MAVNTFIRFETTPGKWILGEGFQKGHAGADGWVECDDWSWEVESATSFTKGTGASVGKPVPGTFSFSHNYDKSSPTLMSMIVKGAHFALMQVDMLKTTGADTGPKLYFQLKAKDVFITKVSSKGSGDGTVTQDIECVFKEVALGYKMQKNDGKLDSAVRDFKWNIAKMSNAISGDIALNMTS
jgi:type VI secretion system secreted protein Hcp